MKMKIAYAGFLAAAVSGCAQSVPFFPAVTSYAPASCSEEVDLATAIDLTPAKKRTAWKVDAPVTMDANCVRDADGETPYVLFALPPANSSKAVEVGSLFQNGSLFAPQISLLDADGNETRFFEDEKMQFRSGIFSARFVPTEAERYALVKARKDIVGMTYDAIRSFVTTQTIYTGVGATNWRSGHEVDTSHGFSYEGVVQGIVYKLDD